jgi:polyhydroxybutyrate depolymerase
MKWVICVMITLIWAYAGGVEAAALEKYHLLMHQVARGFRVYVPEGRVGERGLPMVMMFHGGGGSIDGAVNMTGLDRTADAYGFIVVYPAGTGPHPDHFLTWNAGDCCGSAAEKNVDDVGFVSKIIDFMIQNYHVDETRIYATGHSNGAQMCYRLACELSDRLAAIAANASEGVFEPCRPAHAVPILHIHGTKDNCAKYDGGECGGCFQEFFRGLGIPMKDKTWACDSVEAAVRKWAERNGCEPTRETMLVKGALTCERYPHPSSGADVELCTIQGGGHVWPGGEYGPDCCRRQPDGLLCKRWKEIVGRMVPGVRANEIIWNFFRDRRLVN